MPKNLRHQYIDALVDAGWWPRPEQDVKRIIDAILAVRDEEMVELRERAEKAEAEQEEEYQRAERLQEETSEFLNRCQSAERRRDAAESRLKHLLGVIAEYGDNPRQALMIVQREVSNGLVHRDIELSEARRERDALAVHLARAEAALAALDPPEPR